LIPPITESTLEEEMLRILEALGYEPAFGPDISPGAEKAERTSYGETVLVGRLSRALLPKLISGEPRDSDVELYDEVNK
jgi:hypothetical protein